MTERALPLLTLLRALQKQHGYLPPKVLSEAASALALPLAEVQGVAEFYGFLATQPQGRYRVYFSTCIVDEFKGRAELQDRLCARLGLSPGKARADGQVSVRETSCTGLCDQGPSLLVNGLPIARLAFLDRCYRPAHRTRRAARTLAQGVV